MNKRVTVLVVDANVDAREGLRDLLEAEGVRAYSCSGGEPAKQTLRRLEGQGPCIVLIGHIKHVQTESEQLALVDHELFLLDTALSAINGDEGTDDQSEIAEKPAPRTVKEIIEERRLYQLAMCKRRKSGEHRLGLTPEMIAQAQREYEASQQGSSRPLPVQHSG